jgi:choline-sulfatase
MSDSPNIIFILSDDQGYWALGAAGNNEIITPNLDRLAQTGLRFENFFCVSPVCSPARASLLTGRIPSQHGIHDWLRRGNLADPLAAELGKHNFGEDNTAIEYLRGMTGYTDILAENGYHCGLAGKWHMGDTIRPQKGFSFWHVVPYGGSAYYDAPFLLDGQAVFDPRYLTDAITDHAVQFLEQHTAEQANQPFYLSLNYTAPHSPWDASQHPEELRALYRDCPFESVPDLPAHPWQINSAPRGTGERRRELLTGYYAAITGMDRGIGQILDWLETRGMRENTLVIFTSDNGMNMGHHGIWGKGNGTFPQNMFDTSVKVPAIISQPGTVPQGTVNNDLLSHYDVFPTLLETLGLENPEADLLPGRSFASLLRGQPLDDDKRPVVVFDEYGPSRMIRTREWKYIHRYPYGPNELYNLANDPDEAHNLIADTSTIETAAQLKSELDQWFDRYADPRLDGTREAVYGKGQLTLAGSGGQGRKAHEDDWYYVDEDGKRRE